MSRRQIRAAIRSALISGALVLGSSFTTSDAGTGDVPKQLEDAYSDIGEGAVFGAIKKYLGTDASVWWILARILNSIPGDAAEFEPVQFDPDYADLSNQKLQERLGAYIVARDHVSHLPSTPGTQGSLEALDAEIAKMKSEALKRQQ